MATRIPYLDEVWNVTTGCGLDMVSPGCLGCYARRMFGRNLWKCPECGGEGERITLLGDGVDCPDCDGTGRQDFTPTFHASRLEQPLHWRKPRVVGVSFMGDLFHEGITRVQIGRVLDTFIMCPQHTFLVLTKRPERMREVIAEELRVTNMSRFLNDKLPAGVIPNLWLGVTVCGPEEAWKIDVLRETPAVVRWLSLEPLLGPLPGLNLTGISWVVLGGETGPGARRMNASWAVDVWKQCRAEDVPFYWKQAGSAWLDGDGTDDDDDAAMLDCREMPAVRP